MSVTQPYSDTIAPVPFVDTFCQIAVHAPFYQLLTYKVPTELISDLKTGVWVNIPLGKRKSSSGVFINFIQEDQIPKEISLAQIKDVLEIVTRQWYLPPAYVEWGKWLADYYIYPFGLVLDLMLPIKPLSSKKVKPLESLAVQKESQSKTLLPEQQMIADKIKVYQNFGVHFIFGVTGSGKTEIYLDLFEEVIKKNKKGLFLLPEISLTPQMIRRFSERLGQNVAILHSQLTRAQQNNQWWSIVSGNAKILIGARSALFCPIEDLGLIIIDEEHDSSFKQDSKLRYHARNAAIVLAQKKNIPIVLGSATPSAESWSNLVKNKYHLYELKNRAVSLYPPYFEIIDLKNKSTKKTHPPVDLPHWLSPELYNHTSEALNNGEQVAFFLNRRGTASSVFCDQCGYHVECPNCSISLTLHKHNMLVCHYCGYQQSNPQHCPSCKEGVLKPLGLGTEQIEQDIKKIFPNKRSTRIDRDEITDIKELSQIISSIERQEIDILIGTQMISKGLDFKNLKTVGFVLADMGLNLPDFRAQEKSFQLILQMSGRAGRHALEQNQRGAVLIQTYYPQNPLFKWATQNDYQTFITEELRQRQELSYPPFGRMAFFVIQGRFLDKVHLTAQELNQFILNKIKKSSGEIRQIQILGPTPCALQKVRNQFRYQLILKAPLETPLSALCRWVIENFSLASSVEINVDIDPLHLI